MALQRFRAIGTLVSMPVFVAFAAFLLLIFGHRLGVPIGPWSGSPFRASRKSPGQKAGVQTHSLEMVLDHDSGRMEGRCLNGRFAGRALSSLSDEELIRFLEDLRSTDSQGVLLMEAYLDRRSQGWRDRRSKKAPNVAARINEAKEALLGRN
jgi:hypothetical protein